MFIFLSTMFINNPSFRNCAFEKKAHRVLLSPESDTVLSPFSNASAPGIGILASILLPLAGPEELDLDVCLSFQKYLL
jgi:hypothetical protein